MKAFLKLKLLIIGIVIYQLFSPTAYSQEKVESAGAKKLTEVSQCTQFFDSLSNVQNKSLAKTTDAVLKGLTGDNLKHAANLIYSATEENYSAYHDSLISISLRMKENDKKMGTNSFTPGFMRIQLLDKIKDSISASTYGLTTVAYFLRIEVDSVRHVNGRVGLCTLVSGTIKEVFKGSSKYNVDDKIEFYFYNSWTMGSFPQYNIGQEYFVPLEPRPGGDVYPGYDPIALIVYLDKSHGYYPIENGYLIDKFNFFGLGEKVEYNTFDQNIKNKIEEIKSW